MTLQESIRRILREETKSEENLIPLPIRRRISSDDLEEAFHYALERMGGSMNNPNSIIYKEKGTTLGTFAKFVIDEMVTYIEQDYFNDNNRIYFSDTEEDEETYHEKIRQPLLKYYSKRIKEKYQEVKSEDINESTFFIRRVDMGLINKEFFENLNLITSLYLGKHIDGIDFNFETFEDHVINYFMDGYYNDLTNGGENDYPFDEVYEFLLNHFHKKIKDRYETFFGRNINDSENIIREESGLSPRLLRRVPMDKLEESFGYALKQATIKYYRYQPVLNDDYKLHFFTKEVIELLLDSVSHLMYPTIKGSWYDEEFSKVKEHFQDRITEWWETL